MHFYQNEVKGSADESNDIYNNRRGRVVDRTIFSLFEKKVRYVEIDQLLILVRKYIFVIFNLRLQLLIHIIEKLCNCLDIFITINTNLRQEK